MSHKIDKFKKIMRQREENGKPCDIIHILKINGDESAFLIQDMFPITEMYIDRPYTINGVPLIIKNRQDIDTVQKKANNIYLLIHRKVRLNPTQPDVLSIKKALISDLSGRK